MATNNAFYIDVLPEQSTWQEWSNGFAYVYGAENLPVVDENDWEQFANQVQEFPIFCAVSLPSPHLHESWQDWATDLIAVANGNINA